MTAYLISEVAARTGFSPSTLRYYEDVGLLSPARSRSGYRQYDERSIERLTLVARAKQLGLNLDEIVELVELWDGDRCAPVAERLRALLHTKRAETSARIAELAAFAGQLQQVDAQLEVGADDAPCGPDCACSVPATTAPPAVAVTSLGSRPDVAVDCTLDANEMPERLNAWHAVLAQATDRVSIAGGIQLRFPATGDIAADLARLAAAEVDCCAFFDFRLHLGADGVELDVTAPDDAAPLVAGLFGVAS